MQNKLFYLSFLLFLLNSSRLYGDTLRLKGFDEVIDAKIVEVNEEFVKVTIPQEEIGSVSVQSELPAHPARLPNGQAGGDDKYPDTVFINVNGNEHKVICKIIKIAHESESITLKIPRHKIFGIQIAFPGGVHDRNDDLNERRESIKRDYPPIDPDILKEKIKEELRQEFEEKQRKKDEVSKEKIKKELRIEFEEKKQEEERIFKEQNYGDVKGRMLYKGKPLSGCQVKIVMLEKWGFFGNVKEGLRFETITDEEGRYYFEKVPPGGYKLYWKPPHETSWIRTIKMEPEIFVEPGETFYMRDRETNVRTMN